MGILGGTSDFFGLDISTAVIRVVQLRIQASQRVVFRYGKMTFDQKLAADDDYSRQKLAETIREVLIQSQITTRNVVVGLPTQYVFSAVREFENLSAQEVAKTLKFQAELFIPSKAEDSKIDWAILDTNMKDLAKKDVFICSVEKSYVQKQLELLESVNLNVLAFEPNSVALVRSQAVSDPDSQLLLNTSFYATDVIISYRNQPRLVTSVSVGIFHILKSIVNTLNVDQTNAQQLLFQVGLTDVQTQSLLYSAITSALDILLAQLHQSISYFNGQYQQTLGQVVVCGDLAYLPGLAAFLQQSLNLPVVNGDAWRNVKYPPAVQEALQDMSYSFVVACGLATR